MLDIKSLLGDALRRHQIAPQITTARVIEETNVALARMLPPGRSSDAVAAFVRDGAVMVRCANAAAAAFVSSRHQEILDEVKRRLPNAPVDRISTRLGV